MQSNIGWTLLVALFALLVAIAGIIGFQLNSNKNLTQPAWVFILMIGGTVVLLFCLFLITYFAVKNNSSA